jgi:putative membrane protein
MWWDGGPGPGFWIFGVVGGILFWVLLIMVIVMLVGGRGESRAERPELRRPALDILEEHYARGEIDRDEYLERLSVLAGPDEGKSPRP